MTCRSWRCFQGKTSVRGGSSHLGSGLYPSCKWINMINPTYPTSNWDITNRCNYYVGWATKHSSCSILCTVHKISHMPDIQHMPENSVNKQNCRENVCWPQDEYMTLHDQQSHVASLSDCWRVKLCQTASSECFNPRPYRWANIALMGRQSPCPVGRTQINVVIYQNNSKIFKL